MRSDIIFKKNDRKEDSEISKVLSGGRRARKRPPKRKRMRLESRLARCQRGCLGSPGKEMLSSVRNAREWRSEQNDEAKVQWPLMAPPTKGSALETHEAALFRHVLPLMGTKTHRPCCGLRLPDLLSCVPLLLTAISLDWTGGPCCLSGNPLPPFHFPAHSAT